VRRRHLPLRDPLSLPHREEDMKRAYFGWCTLALGAAVLAAVPACSDEGSDKTGDGLGESGAGAEPGSGGSNTGKGGSGGSSGSGNGATGAIINPTDGGATGDGGAENCGETSVEAAPAQANILLVIDKSSSMNAEGGFSESKWTALGGALESAIAAAATDVSFGLDFYPFSDDHEASPTECETPTEGGPLIPIAAGTESVPFIVEALNTYTPAGGTPTAAALTRALEYFTEGEGSELTGANYVLLATDGGPNCNPDLTCETASCTLNMEGMSCGPDENCCDAALDPDGPRRCLDDDGTVDAVTALAEAGVNTFVVGIPGTEFYEDTLNRVAVAGRAANPDAPPSYYKVTADGDAEGLADVLTAITTGVITTCRLTLTSTPPDPDYEGLLNVVIDGEKIAQAGDDGWEVDTTTSPPTVVLKGATCEQMETEGAQSVSITYGCPTFDPR
jgi:hypothetical protein